MSWLDSSLSAKDGDEPLVCFASDVGISAIRSIIRQWAGKRPIMLDHLDRGVTVFDKEMKDLVGKTKVWPMKLAPIFHKVKSASRLLPINMAKKLGIYRLDNPMMLRR